MKVEAHGQFSGDTFAASSVELQDVAAPPVPAPPDDPDPEVEFSGAVGGLTGSATGFQFTVGSRLVKGDATTAVVGESNKPKSFADLKNGVTVEVKGEQRSGFVQALRIHVEDAENEPEPEPEPEVETELEGSLSGLQGTCPAIVFTVSGKAVTTSATTRFDGAACSALKNGDRVGVKGTKRTDGSVAATRVEKKGS